MEFVIIYYILLSKILFQDCIINPLYFNQLKIIVYHFSSYRLIFFNASQHKYQEFSADDKQVLLWIRSYYRYYIWIIIWDWGYVMLPKSFFQDCRINPLFLEHLTTIIYNFSPHRPIFLSVFASQWN